MRMYRSTGDTGAPALPHHSIRSIRSILRALRATSADEAVSGAPKPHTRPLVQAGKSQSSAQGEKSRLSLTRLEYSVVRTGQLLENFLCAPRSGN